MQQQLELRREMSEVRSRGLANAAALAQRVERLSDWREHVRANPWPIAIAAAALGYWMIPSRPRVVESPKPSNGSPDRESESVLPTERELKVASATGLGSAALGFVGSLIGNAVRSYVSDQVHTLISSRGNHASTEQRSVPFTRY